MATTCDDNDGNDDVKKDIPPISILGMIHLEEKYFSLANSIANILKRMDAINILHIDV